MRTQILSVGTVVLAACWLLQGCMSVPDGAPQEFYDAKNSLKTMDNKDVDEYLPKTAERAENTFAKALETLENYRDEDESGSLQEAISLANESNKLSTGATRLRDQLKEWDRDDSSFEKALAYLDEYQNPSIDVAVVETQSPFAKLKGSEIVSTVAYFKTGRSEPSMLDEQEMSSLVNILKKDEGFQVILTGYADPRGDQFENKLLSQKRARMVAQRLEKEGVRRNQIIIEGAGETGNRSKSPLQLQFDRKVKARLVLQ